LVALSAKIQGIFAKRQNIAAYPSHIGKKSMARLLQSNSLQRTLILWAVGYSALRVLRKEAHHEHD